MPVRLNPLEPPAQPTVLLEAGTQANGPNGAPSSNRPVQNPIFGGLRRGVRSLAGCFSPPAESRRQRFLMMTSAAAVDRWTAAHGGARSKEAGTKIKEMLEKNFSSDIQLRDPPVQLILSSRGLRSIPPEIAQAKALQTLLLANNELTSFPAEMGQAKALQSLNLYRNDLTSFPAEMGQAKALAYLNLGFNHLTSFPPEMGQVKGLRTLNLQNNQLTDFPAEIASLPHLRHLDLSNNLLTQVPRALLDAPVDAEIDLQNNPLPDAEIQAVRDAIAERRAAGQPVPNLLLPPLAEEAGDLREAVANEMNVHTGVLTQAFKKRLDDLARQFPDHLNGSNEQQRHAMQEIETRLISALDAHALDPAHDAAALAKARNIARLMFQKGLGELPAYVNDFQHVVTGSDVNVVTGTTGHVLSYTFLALEAQWTRTPEPHQAEARENGMKGLVSALDSGSGRCDTRLCEEVLQMVGLPLSTHAEAHPEVVAIQPVQSSIEESREIVMEAAKKVLQALLDIDPALSNESPPAVWRSTLAATMQRDHPNVPAEQVEKQMQYIESAWESFHEIVVEQHARDR